MVDNQGKPSFQMLQKRSRLPSGWSLVYYAFDLLHLDGADLKDRPLRERRALLKKALGNWGEGVTADEMADYTWLRPEIEAEIKFTEWTAASLLRHAEFVTLREM